MSLKTTVRTTKCPQGFTLVEMLVTIGVFVIVAGLSIGLFLQVYAGQAKVRVRSDMADQARLVVERLTYEMRRARGIEATSDFGVNLATVGGATLDLDMPIAGDDPTTISVVGGVVFLKQGAGSTVELSSDDVTVSNLTFTDTSSVNNLSDNVSFELTITHANPTGGVPFTYTVQSAVELRGK